MFYIIEVAPAVGDKWQTKKRYSHFEDFHAALLDCVSSSILPAGAELPGKKIPFFTSATSLSLIEERSVLLQNYLRKIITVHAIASSPLLVNFLQMDSLIENVPTTRHDPTEAMHAFDFPDDAEVTEITVPQTRTMSDHILYQIDAVNVRQRKSFQKWTVLKRFAAIVEMDEALRLEFASRADVLAQLPPTPEKHYKVVFDHLNFHFVEQRRALIESYLQRLLVIEPVLYSPTFLIFLGVNY